MLNVSERKPNGVVNAPCMAVRRVEEAENLVHMHYTQPIQQNIIYIYILWAESMAYQMNKLAEWNKLLGLFILYDANMFSTVHW